MHFILSKCHALQVCAIVSILCLSRNLILSSNGQKKKRRDTMNRNILTCELFIFLILVINPPSFKYKHGLVLHTFFYVILSISMILFPYALVEFTPREICNPLFSTFILGLRSWCKEELLSVFFNFIWTFVLLFQMLLIWTKMEMGLYFTFDCVWIFMLFIGIRIILSLQLWKSANGWYGKTWAEFMLWLV